jgi:hypothetical protein
MLTTKHILHALMTLDVTVIERSDLAHICSEVGEGWTFEDLARELFDNDLIERIPAWVWTDQGMHLKEYFKTKLAKGD